jgi:tRNA pseudouridine38-40 synthase
MEKIIHSFLGYHDFSSFRSPECQILSTWKTISQVMIQFNPSNSSEILIEFQAPSFLQQQVRRMVGAIVLVGRGHWSIDDFYRFKNKMNPLPIMNTAPPHGLILMKVGYQDDIF